MEHPEIEGEHTIEESIPKEIIPEVKDPEVNEVKAPEVNEVKEDLILIDDKQQEEKKRKQDEEDDKVASISHFPQLHVMKYGRRGKPHQRVLCLVSEGPPSEASFIWYKPRLVKKKPSSRPIHLRDVVDVRKGKMTTVFQRPIARDVDDDKCFSVVTTDRTLDVVVNTVEERDKAADMILEIYKKITKEDLLVGVRVRRQSALLERQAFFDLVEKHLLALHGETKAIWSRGMNSVPAEMIDKDFPRLAKNFQIYRVTKKGGPTSITLSPPPVEFPKSFTQLDPKALSDRVSSSTSGSGKKAQKRNFGSMMIGGAEPKLKLKHDRKETVMQGAKLETYHHLSPSPIDEQQRISNSGNGRPSSSPSTSPSTSETHPNGITSLSASPVTASPTTETTSSSSFSSSSSSTPSSPDRLEEPTLPKSHSKKRQNSVPTLSPSEVGGATTASGGLGHSSRGGLNGSPESRPQSLKRRNTQPLNLGSPLLGPGGMLEPQDMFMLSEPESKTDDYIRKRLDLCDYNAPPVANVRSVMQVFSYYLCEKNLAEELLKKFLLSTSHAEGGDRDISIIIRDFFNNEFKDIKSKQINNDGSGGGSSSSEEKNHSEIQSNVFAILALLKSCNQNIIFPAVFLLKQVILDTFRARDVHEKGGWNIAVEFHEKKTVIIHKRREICDTGHFTYQWGLTLTFDVPSYELVDTTVNITELNFDEDASPRVKHELSTKLFSVNRLGMMLANKKKKEQEQQQHLHNGTTTPSHHHQQQQHTPQTGNRRISSPGQASTTT